MFIKKLYQHSKTTCLFFVGFIVAFVFINYKWGLVATPVLEYGMFSGSFHIKDTQTVMQIYLNDKRLDYTQYSVAQRDMIGSYPVAYLSEKEINDATFATMKRLLSKVGIGRWMQKEDYVNHITDETFAAWYKTLLEKITGEKINKLEVYKQKYLWDGNALAPAGEPNKINNLAVTQ